MFSKTENAYKPSIVDRLKFLFTGNAAISTRFQQYGMLGYGFTIPDSNKKKLIDNGYLNNASVYAIVKMISRQAAMPIWSTYKVVDETEFKRYRAISSQPINTKSIQALKDARYKALQPLGNTNFDDVLKYPNDEQGQSEYTEQLIAYKLLTGDSYEFALQSELGRLKGQPLAMYVMPSDMMHIVTTGTFPVHVDSYELQAEQTIRFNREEILHTKFWSPKYSLLGDHLYGLSPLQSAYLSILTDNESREAGIELMQNRGTRKIVAWDTPTSIPVADFKDISAQQAGRFQERWKQLKLENKGDVAMIAGKLTAVDVGLGIKDLQILEVSGYTLDDLCNIYNVSSTLFNNHDASTESNVTQMRIDFIQKAVLPELNQIRDARNRKLQTDWGFKGQNIVVDYDASVFTELQQDKSDLAEWLNKAWWISPNRKNFWMDEPVSDDPLMDKVYIPTNLQSLENINKTTTGNDTIQDQNSGSQI